MRLLVTGGAGFIGHHLCTELRDHGHDTIVMDVKHEPLLDDCRIPGNLDRMLGSADFDMVVHLAARVGRLFGEDDVAETIADNAGMTATVAKACGEWGVPLAYASTSEIYGDCGQTIAYEGMQLTQIPHNVYGLSKRWGEEACKLYAPDGLVILRLSMPYGPGLPYGRGRAALVNFLHQALTGQTIPVHFGAERSWCFVGDTVRAIRIILESGETGAFNVGRDDNALPLARVAEMACELAGASTDLIEEIPAPAKQTVVKRLATNKVRALGWEPKVSLEEGMALTMNWVVAQMECEKVAA